MRRKDHCCHAAIREDASIKYGKKPSAETADGFLVWYGDRIKTGALLGNSVAAAAAAVAADARCERLKRAVFAHTVHERGEERPAASSECARGKYVAARSENEQDDENPETAIAAKTAIHSFSSYQLFRKAVAGDGRRVCILRFLRSLLHCM